VQSHINTFRNSIRYRESKQQRVIVSYSELKRKWLCNVQLLCVFTCVANRQLQLQCKLVIVSVHKWQWQWHH